MQILEKTRTEIENKINTMSDFLKMEYLEECSKQNMDLAIKKFCNEKLAELYEVKKMFSEAAKRVESVAEMASTYKDKIQTYINESRLWIRGGDYERADECLQKALACASAREREGIKKTVIEIYKAQAQVFAEQNRNSYALKIYEKLLHIVSDDEKADIKKKILPLYKKLGKIREYTILSEQISKL